MESMIQQINSLPDSNFICHLAVGIIPRNGTIDKMINGVPVIQHDYEPYCFDYCDGLILATINPDNIDWDDFIIREQQLKSNLMNFKNKLLSLIDINRSRIYALN